MSVGKMMDATSLLPLDHFKRFKDLDISQSHFNSQLWWLYDINKIHQHNMKIVFVSSLHVYKIFISLSGFWWVVLQHFIVYFWCFITRSTGKLCLIMKPKWRSMCSEGRIAWHICFFLRKQPRPEIRKSTHLYLLISYSGQVLNKHEDPFGIRHNSQLLAFKPNNLLHYSSYEYLYIKVRASLVIRTFLPIPGAFGINSHLWQVGIPFISLTCQRFLFTLFKKNY